MSTRVGVLGATAIEGYGPLSGPTAGSWGHSSSAARISRLALAAVERLTPAREGLRVAAVSPGL